MSKGLLLIFSAASGAGKSTILERVEKTFSNLVYSISATTREPRGSEKEGIEYFFLTRDEFKKGIDDDEFVEWAEVHSNYYGTPKKFIDEQLELGNIVAFDIDVQGKVLMDKIYSESTSIFIETPSEEELEGRLRSRATDSEKDILLRLSNAKKENSFAKNGGNYSFYVMNDDLDRAVEEVTTIIKEALSE